MKRELYEIEESDVVDGRFVIPEGVESVSIRLSNRVGYSENYAYIKEIKKKIQEIILPE